MGPTGTPTEIPSGKTVLLAGGGLGNAVLFSIAQGAARERGNRVIYFAGYRKPADLFKREEVEAATDVSRLGRRSTPATADRAAPAAGLELRRQHRPGDGGLREGRARRRRRFELDDVDRLIAIGSDRMMAAVQEARHGRSEPYLEARARRRSGPSTRRCNA